MNAPAHDRAAGAAGRHLPPWALDPPAASPDRTLVDHVHPPDWVNPRPAGRYHLVVVGAGTAGLVSAAGAAGLGARVALVERSLMGGDCLNVGCVPSKAVIRAARGWSEARRAADRFGGPEAAGDGDFTAAMARMRRLRAGIAPHDGAARFRDLGIDVFLGDGRFVAPDAVEVAGQRLAFRRAVVATGARALVPPIEGLEGSGYRTNETIFALERRPERLAVLGAGPIGCELAQAFARLGCQVTLLDMAPHVMPREDPDAAAVVEAALARDGVRLELGVSVGRVSRDGEARVVHFTRGGEGGKGRREGAGGHGGAGGSGGEAGRGDAGGGGAGGEDAAAAGGAACEVAVDELLVAVGRAPNVEGLGLEAAGIEIGRQGVEVDDRLRTTNRRVYAAGDVSSRFKFTHAADAEARIVLQNALFFGRKKASALVVPWCTYTSPEVAHVGMSATDAEEKGVEFDTVTVPLAAVDRAILDGETEGFLRVVLARGKDTILGATLVSEHAGESIGELTLAIGAGLGLGRLAEVIHPYPTQAEAIKKAADQWRRGKLTPRVQRLFATWFAAWR
jgi:pyruvate/2-oxoglutarate dehydrogenase complex dihydrolipoamide dehydrogenase (E3) component